METNKENIENFKSSSKIPVPVSPLPALPKYLLNDNKSGPELPRPPLKLISNENLADASQGEVAYRKKRTVIIDARYVTLRPKTDNSAMKYKVFNDKPTTSKQCAHGPCKSAATSNTNEFSYFVQNTQGSSFDDETGLVTPSIKSLVLEPNRIKNIKRSLKRPHSRELQGVSPLSVASNINQLKVKRQLEFNESLQINIQSPEIGNESYVKCLSQEYTTDVFNHLLTSEKKLTHVPKTPSVTRACIINWIMRVNNTIDNPAVVQSACWYLDSLLGTVNIQLDRMQLMAAACYWIAQKQTGPVYRAKRLVKFANQAFSTHRLLAAEKWVLRNLKFPILPVVPQDFINYMAWWCDNEYPTEIETAATFLCMSGLMVDMSLCDEYPSVVAASAVYNALLLLRKKSLIKHLQAAPVYKAALMKATDISNTNLLLRKAVRMVASPYYEYKAPYERYGMPPVYIAHRVVHAANDLVNSSEEN